MKKRLLLTLTLATCLSGCYAWEMVLEDPLDRVEKRQADLCPLAMQPTAQTSSKAPADFEWDKLNQTLARQFPRELALQTLPYQGEACSSDSTESVTTKEGASPLLVRGWVKAQEYQQSQQGTPLGWPGRQETARLEIKMELHLAIWQRQPALRLKAITVSETARAAHSDRPLLLAQLQERLVQKAFQGLQTHYSYR
jgi:hypothetical protein